MLRGIERFSASPRPTRASAPSWPDHHPPDAALPGREGHAFPDDRAQIERLAGDLETLLPREAALRQFVEAKTLAEAHLTLITRRGTFPEFGDLDRFVKTRWQEAVALDAGLASFRLDLTGQGPLQAKISHHLVPTLTQSFGLTAAIIFVAFLFVFRAARRLMAMIPSPFAISCVRVHARGRHHAQRGHDPDQTTVPRPENDQIHFFYHFLERSKGRAPRRNAHAVAGRAIVFATLINAGGFLAFAMSNLPPLRHFGMLTAIAFLLSMIADFTALPAALWIVYREKPGVP